MRNGSENGVKLLLCQRLYAPFLRYTSVVKTFNAYSGCSLCPTLFYLGYVLGPGSLSLLVFVRCPQLSQNRRYSGNAIDRFRKPRPPSERSWNLHILRKVWLIFKYALLEGLNYTLAFVPCPYFSAYCTKVSSKRSRRRSTGGQSSLAAKPDPRGWHSGSSAMFRAIPRIIPWPL